MEQTPNPDTAQIPKADEFISKLLNRREFDEKDELDVVRIFNLIYYQTNLNKRWSTTFTVFINLTQGSNEKEINNILVTKVIQIFSKFHLLTSQLKASESTEQNSDLATALMYGILTDTEKAPSVSLFR